MSKSAYTVPYVRKDLLSAWNAYWIRRETTKEIMKLVDSGLLGLSARVDAKNKAEAAKLVEREHPGHIVISESIQRHGRA